MLRGQARTASAGDLLTAMLDQETGVRGFDQTGSEEFLGPDYEGRTAFDVALATAERQARDEGPVALAQLRDQAATARRWQAHADDAVAAVRQHGAGALTGSGIRARKALMDRFRRKNSVFREHVRTVAAAELRAAQWTAIGSVVLVATLLLGGGLLLVEHGARRSASRRRAEREFGETLQGAEHEDEAQHLLQQTAWRSAAVLPTSAARATSRSSRAGSAARCPAPRAARRRSSAAR